MEAAKKEKLSKIRDRIAAMVSIYFENPVTTTFYTFVEDADAEIRIDLKENTEIPFSDVAFLMVLASKFKCDGTIMRDNSTYILGVSQPMLIVYNNFRGLE